MNVVYLLDPKTQVGYPIASFDTSTKAMNYKDLLRARLPANIFYHRVNVIEPEKRYSLREALAIVNGND